MSNAHDTDDTALRLALRGLRREIAPGRDLWPEIAARLPAQAAAAPPTRLPPRRRGWPWPLALAASLVLAVGLVWQLRPETTPVRPETARPQLAAQTSAPPVATSAATGTADAHATLPPEAALLTWHYEAALGEIGLHQVPASWQPGLQALDRSAEQVRQALREQPDSRLLLERLRETYLRRLALTRRALYA